MVYFLWRKEQEEQTAKIHDTQKISEEKTLFPTLDKAGERILYFNNENDPAFYQFNIKTEKESKISQSIDSPNGVIWSPLLNQAILKVIYDKYIFEKYGSVFESPDAEDGSLTFWLYDLNKNTAKQLDSRIQNVAWSPDGKKIVYHFVDWDEDLDFIALANPDGSSWQKIKDIDSGEGIDLGFLTQEIIYYSPLLTEIGGTNIYKVNLTTKETTTLIDDNSAASSLVITPNREKIIYAHYQEEEQKYILGTMNLDSNDKQTLNVEIDINRTIVLPDNPFIITAIAQEKTPDYDNFYKVNIETGERELLFKSTNKEHYSAENLMISEDGKTLYFTSDDYLYKMNLE